MLTIQIVCVLLGMWIYKMDKNESSAIILLMFYWHYRTFHLDTVIFNWFLRIDIKCLRL